MTKIQFNTKFKIQFNAVNVSKTFAVLLGLMIPISTSLTNIVLTGLIISWFLAGHLQEKAQYIFRHPVAKLCFGFFGVFLIGCLYSNAPFNDMQDSLWKMSKLLYLPFLLPLMREENWRKMALWAFTTAMLLTLVLSLLKMYGGFNLASRHTAACVFKNHIDTNLMMAFATFFIGHAVVLGQNIKVRFLGLALIALMSFYVLWMSEGRSGYIIFSALWILFFFQKFRFKHFMFGALTLCILLASATFGSTRFQDRFNAAIQETLEYQADNSNSETSLGARIEFAMESWHLIQQKLWWGFGTGSFKQVYAEHAKSNALSPTRNPHNEYVNVMLQLGILGLITLVGLFYGMLKLSFRLPRFERDLVQGVLMAIMLGCLANSWLMDFTSGYFFVALSAFCFGALPLSHKKDLKDLQDLHVSTHESAPKISHERSHV